jgi:hypothetical protein
MCVDWASSGGEEADRVISGGGVPLRGRLQLARSRPTRSLSWVVKRSPSRTLSVLGGWCAREDMWCLTLCSCLQDCRCSFRRRSPPSISRCPSTNAPMRADMCGILLQGCIQQPTPMGEYHFSTLQYFSGGFRDLKWCFYCDNCGNQAPILWKFLFKLGHLC